jgi:hypothetical protein
MRRTALPGWNTGRTIGGPAGYARGYFTWLEYSTLVELCGLARHAHGCYLAGVLVELGGWHGMHMAASWLEY